MPASTTPLSKRVLYYSIMIVMLLLIIELFCRAYYYQRQSLHPLAMVQIVKDVQDRLRRRRAGDTSTRRLQNNHYLVRPGFSKAENDKVVREMADANEAVYQPWVEFSFRDIQSRYVNITGHVRRSIPERSDSLAKQPLKIFFLGGSTLYGFNVTDAETIPSCFVREYRLKYPGGRPIQAVDLAMPSYYSYQELILLADKIFRDDRPGLVIMLDGLNDCFQATASYTRAPVYTPGIGGQIRPGSGDNRLRLPNFFDMPSGTDEDSAARAIYQCYLGNIRHVRELTAAGSIPLYCFWQPVPYYNYPNRLNDPICTHATLARFEKIYPLVKKNAGDLPYLYYLGDMLQEEKGLPFIDQIHYSPRFNQAIAQKMLDVMKFPGNP